MAYASVDTNVEAYDVYGFDGLNRKRVKVAQELLEADSAAIVTQNEQINVATLLNVNDVGSVLRHSSHNEPEFIEGTARHELELLAMTISRSATATAETVPPSRLIFHNSRGAANGTQEEVFSLGVDATGLDKMITLPGPVRFTEGISVRCVQLDGQPGPQVELMTLFYKEVSFNTHYTTALPDVESGQSIQSAIDLALPNGIVRVGPGTFTEDITISKQGLRLITEHDAKIIGDITIAADSVTLDGFVLQSQAQGAGIAIRVESGINSTIQNVRVENFDFGAVHTTSTDVSYLRCTFFNNNSGIDSTQNVTGLRIKNNRFEQNGVAINLDIGSILAAPTTIEDVLLQNLFVANAIDLLDSRENPPVEYGGSTLPPEPPGPTPDVVSGESIQLAVDAAAENDTVFVGPGVYNEIVTLSKGISLVASGDVNETIIQRPVGSNSLGTVLIVPNTTGVTINGFTIVGGNSSTPAIEFAAVYIQGNGHADHVISNNKIIANGDAGLMTEFNASVVRLLIEANTFDGTTFEGPTPAEGDQFTVENVARQMVVISGGATVTNTQDVTFVSNIVQGASGSDGVGNVGVTIDVVRGFIAANTFTIDTGGSRPALRVRGVDTVLQDNVFGGNNTGLENTSTSSDPVLQDDTGLENPNTNP